MNVGQLLQKVYDLIAAFKANNWFLAFSLAMEIVRAITDSLPPTAFSKPMTVQGDMSCEDIVAKLEFVCADHGGDTTAAVEGPFIDKLLSLLQPLVIALLKKLIGL